MPDQSFGGPDDPQNPYSSPKSSGNFQPGMVPADEDSEMTQGDWVLAMLCSGIGCIMGIVWLVQGKKKAGKMIGISFLFAIIWRVVITMIRTAANV